MIRSPCMRTTDTSCTYCMLIKRAILNSRWNRIILRLRLGVPKYIRYPYLDTNPTTESAICAKYTEASLYEQLQGKRTCQVSASCFVSHCSRRNARNLSSVLSSSCWRSVQACADKLPATMLLTLLYSSAVLQVCTHVPKLYTPQKYRASLVVPLTMNVWTVILLCPNKCTAMSQSPIYRVWKLQPLGFLDGHSHGWEHTASPMYDDKVIIWFILALLSHLFVACWVSPCCFLATLPELLNSLARRPWERHDRGDHSFRSSLPTPSYFVPGPAEAQVS